MNQCLSILEPGTNEKKIKNDNSMVCVSVYTLTLFSTYILISYK